jgi:hypothetical protein
LLLSKAACEAANPPAVVSCAIAAGRSSIKGERSAETHDRCSLQGEASTMSGIGKFKLSDALPKTIADASKGAKDGSKSRGKSQVKPSSGWSKQAKAGDSARSTTSELTAEQTRESRESAQAKNAEASIRGHMVDIGRGNQQAGRQGVGGRGGK